MYCQDAECDTINEDENVSVRGITRVLTSQIVYLDEPKRIDRDRYRYEVVLECYSSNTYVCASIRRSYNNAD